MTNSVLRQIFKSFVYKIISDEKQRFDLLASIRERTNAAWLLDSTVRMHRSRLIGLRNQYKNHRCFIMGNGPSLNVTPLEKLQDEYVWGSNRCYLIFNKISWRPSFYTAVDTRVVPDNAEEINNLIHQNQNTLFFFPLHFRLNKIINSDRNTYWYRERPIDDNNLPFGHFSTEIQEYVRSVRTVTIAALQIAVFLGFNPIYLIGCDTNYVIPSTTLFEDPQKDSLISTSNNDPNHFSEHYFGAGKKYHQPHPDRMIFNYLQAKKVCDSLGVKVFNATVGGKLEVFQRIQIEDLF